MTLQDLVARATAKVRRTLTGESYVNPLVTFEGPPELEAEPGELSTLFHAHQGRVVNKWLHYLPIYDRWFGPHVGTGVRMLEIGVSHGGSLELWRKFFGEKAVLVGIDINPACADRVDLPNQVRIGSQDDPAFMKGVVAEMGGVDIVLDDGSHIGRHQAASFEALFSLLPVGGLYIIEDMHAAYWPGGFEGGYRKPGTSVELVKSMIDAIHHWYHDKGGRPDIGAIHVYDSLTVIEKGDGRRPANVARPVQKVQGSVTDIHQSRVQAVLKASGSS